MLVIVGLGAQLVAVSDEFCAELAGRGFRVIRFDNRDVGRSTMFSASGTPSLWQLLRRDPTQMPYTLDEMTADSIHLLDTLGVDRGHFVGFSMGGMIAQIAAVRYAGRVSSLASVMSSTGSVRKGRPALRFLRPATRRGALNPADAIARRVEMAQARGRGGVPESQAELWRIARLSHARNNDRSGPRRQLGALLSAGDRTSSLARISAPTVVVHGAADRFVHPSGGQATAAAIPGASFHLIEDMAHNLPSSLRPRVVDLIATNAETVEES
jgi:pimeloyl-ACP methyl ester carboxylesterase